MTTPQLVEAFYGRIWNAGDLSATADLLTADFEFRGSLGPEMRGRAAFTDYARSVLDALGEYRCEILDCVAEGPLVFARMRFSGRHRGVFRGFEPTGKPVGWQGAALFRFDGARIASLWVLGDLAGLDAILAANQSGPDTTHAIG